MQTLVLIRAQFLQKIKDAYDNDESLRNLLLDPYFKDIVTNYQSALRDVVATGVQNGVPTPGFSAIITSQYIKLIKCLFFNPLCMEHTFNVFTFVSVRTEVVTLCLD